MKKANQILPELEKKSLEINRVDLSHHLRIGDDWGEVIFYLENFGTDKQIDLYITNFKKQVGPNFDDSDFDHVGEFKKWLKYGGKDINIFNKLCDNFYKMEIEDIENIMQIMGYNWKDHYECYSDFITNLSESLYFNLKD